MSMSGKVLQFARLEPPYARLVGPAGTDIGKTITITREEAYPFNIVDAKARNGKDIDFKLEDFNKKDGSGYILTITNKKSRDKKKKEDGISGGGMSAAPTSVHPPGYSAQQAAVRDMMRRALEEDQYSALGVSFLLICFVVFVFGCFC